MPAKIFDLAKLFSCKREPDITPAQREKAMSELRERRRLIDSLGRMESMLLDMRAAHRRLEQKVEKVMSQNQQVLEQISQISAGVATLLAEKADAYTNAAAANTQAAIDSARKAWDAAQEAKDEAATQAAQADWAEAHTALQKVIDQLHSNQPITPVGGGEAVPSPADQAVAQQAATEASAPTPGADQGTVRDPGAGDQPQT